MLRGQKALRLNRAGNTLGYKKEEQNKQRMVGSEIDLAMFLRGGSS